MNKKTDVRKDVKTSTTVGFSSTDSNATVTSLPNPKKYSRCPNCNSYIQNFYFGLKCPICGTELEEK